MRKHFLRTVTVMVLICVFMIGCALSASAAVPYASYNYNCDGEVVESDNIYEPEAAFTGNDFGVGDFYNPTDLFIRNKVLYVLDAGNNRVVAYDTESKSAREIYLSDENANISKATGIYVDRNY